MFKYILERICFSFRQLVKVDKL